MTDMVERTMNEKEDAACASLFNRSADGAVHYEAFKARFQYINFVGCWLGQWCGMTVGIESDGFTHT